LGVGTACSDMLRTVQSNLHKKGGEQDRKGVDEKENKRQILKPWVKKVLVAGTGWKPFGGFAGTREMRRGRKVLDEDQQAQRTERRGG